MKKGQMTFIGLISVLITLILYFTAVQPIIQPFIDSYQGGEADTLLAQLLPFFILLAIIFSGIFFYMMPRFEGQKYR